MNRGPESAPGEVFTSQDATVTTHLTATSPEETAAKLQQLRDKYESPKRSSVASSAQAERIRLRNEEKKRKDELLQALTAHGNQHELAIERLHQDAQLKEGIAKAQIASLRDSINLYQGLIQSEQKQLGVSSKLRSLFRRSDASLESIHKNNAQLEKLKAELLVAEATYQNLKKEFEKNRNQEDENHQSSLSEVLQKDQSATVNYRDANKSLYHKVKAFNQDSKVRTKNTLEALSSGNLDIAKLAIQNNAVVIHAVPLDGWSIKNTAHNNAEMDVVSSGAQEKLASIVTNKPDLSASVLSLENPSLAQGMFYPYSYILEGSVISSHNEDVATKTNKKARYLGYGANTLQEDPVASFSQVANSDAKMSQGGRYNELIVHNPSVKGVLIDYEAMTTIYAGNSKEVAKIFNLDVPLERQEFEMLTKKLEQQGHSPSLREGTPESGVYKGKHIGRVTWQRKPIDQAIDFANETMPGAPIYMKKKDGVYTQDGRKVTAEDVYR